ncbi:MAG: DUF5664 domain-containing protein [Desulfovibrio sp.]|jgi:hypothetical protein|nr:DUF5664 domain-containing protein [Desulfovibrio sp.]
MADAGPHGEPKKYSSNWPKPKADTPEPEPAPEAPAPDEQDAGLADETATADETAAAPEPDRAEEQADLAPDPDGGSVSDGLSLYLPDVKLRFDVPTGGVKHDASKLRLDLIPPEILRALGEVLTYGADKYTDRNWERGITLDRVYAALMRHLLAWREGEAVDAESGLPHLAHALTNAGMLLTLERRRGE